MPIHSRNLISCALLCAWIAGCTTPPQSSSFLSSSDALNFANAEGVRTKRVSAPAPHSIVKGTPLYLAEINLSDDVVGNAEISAEDRALLLNKFARSLCAEFAEVFEISDTPHPEALQMRAQIRAVKETGRTGAAISTAAGLVLPVAIRAPVDLGALSTEMELLDPEGQQLTAMVWTRDADVLSTTSVSDVGDAYNFTTTAARDFRRHVIKNADRAVIRSQYTRNPFKGQHDACAAYGEPNWVLSRVSESFGVSPNVYDTVRALQN